MTRDWDAAYRAGKHFWQLPSADVAALVAQAEHMADRPLVTVADLGCGEGGLVCSLAMTGREVWGVDGSAVAIERAVSRAVAAGVSGQTHWYVDDLQQPTQEWINHRYDLIISSLTVAFLNPVESWLQFVADHLAPAGVLLIVTPIVDGEQPSTAWSAIAVDAARFPLVLAKHFSHVALGESWISDNANRTQAYLCQV